MKKVLKSVAVLVGLARVCISAEPVFQFLYLLFRPLPLGHLDIFEGAHWDPVVDRGQGFRVSFDVQHRQNGVLRTSLAALGTIESAFAQRQVVL